MTKAKSRVIVTIDSNTIFRILLILLGILFLYYILNVLVIALVAFIIVSAITPLVDYLERFRLPRSLVVVLIYIIAIGGIFYLLSLLIPAVGEQIRNLSQNLPLYSQKLAYLQEKYRYILGSGTFLEQEKNTILINLGNRLNENWWDIFSQAGSFFVGLVDFVAVFSLAFFLTIQKKNVGDFFKAFIPVQHREYAVTLTERIRQKMGYWLLGQMSLNIIVGVLVYIGLSILGVPYALLLGVVAGVLEVIPFIGPLFSALFGTLVALSVSPLIALIALVIYVVIQQFEAHIIIPLVMKRAVGLNPVAVVVAILIGLKFAGALGIILAIPITAALSVFVSDFIAPETDKGQVSKQ